MTKDICLKCGHRFAYWEKYQTTYRLYWRMTCRHCGTRYNVLARYRFLYGLICVAPLLVRNVLLDLQDKSLLMDWPFLAFFTVWAVGLTFALVPFAVLTVDPKEGEPLESVLQNTEEKVGE